MKKNFAILLMMLTVTFMTSSVSLAADIGVNNYSEGTASLSKQSRLYVEYYIDEFKKFYPNFDAQVPDTYLFDGYLYGSRCHGELTLYNKEFSPALLGWYGYYHGNVIGES